ncbi:TPA: 3'-5' exoribonuclease [Escherichia coli]|nr:exonuclease [Escherichia coli]EFQ8979592.1 exonuclease [Escherichia coli]EGT6660236.1 exonuclease [Escherichia coli]EJF8681596.1 3'-5' exoribonuclease [Escherichia coli]HCB9407202.1 3'-5' exoribonuclease [Escherichia coli]
MSTDKETFALYCEAKNDKVRKRLGIKGGFYWTTAKKLSVAISRCITAMDDNDYDEDDFKKPVRVHLPVVNDLPPEGVFDTEFCNRYEKGGEDGITMIFIAPSPSAQDKPASTDNTCGEAVTGVSRDCDEQSDSQTENADKSESPDSNDDCPECEIPVSTLSLTHRFLHLYFFGQEFDEKYKHHATPEQRKDVIRIEMDMEDGNIQSLLTAVRSHPELDKLTNHHLGRLAHSVEKAFTHATTRRISPAEFDKFISTWMKTDYLDQGLLTKEWAKGNCVSEINRTPSGANAGGGILTDRGEGFVHDDASVERDVAAGVLARSMDIDIYNPHPAHAKRIEEIVSENKPPFSVFRDKFIAMPGHLDYSRAIVVASVKEAPIGIEATPHRVTEYLNKVLTETDHANPDPEIVDIACGRSSAPIPQRVTKEGKQDDEEKPQPSGAMADEQATAETMAADTVEHHQDPQPLDDKSQVKVTAEEVNKIMEAADISRPDADKLLAASRGEFVEGISDPNDSKWVKGIETCDSVNQNQQETEQNGQKAEQNSPNALQNEPETKQPEPVVQQEEEKVCTACNQTGGGNCPDCGAVMGDATYQETFNEESQDEAREKDPEEMESAGLPNKECTEGDQHANGNNETGETANPLIKVNGHREITSTNRLWHHLMIDLETMGKNPDAPIASIGAVFFDPQTGEQGPEFSKIIDMGTCGGTVDISTIEWWLQRSGEARAAILADRIPLDDALLQLREFIDENSGEFFVQVWGNGANFDNVILRRSYERQEIPCPWRYTNDRDVRTMVALGLVMDFDARNVTTFEGERHNALHDARYQAKYVSAIWQKLFPSQADF